MMLVSDKSPNPGAQVAARSSAGVEGRCNSVQRTSLQWNDAYPYSAVHIIRVPGALDFERLTSAVRVVLAKRGLTGLVLNRRAATYEYRGGPARCEIDLIAEEDGASVSLTSEIERQLNTAFTVGECFDPFRFFVAPGRDSFALGLAYFHAIADAESIVSLMIDLVDTWLRGGKPGSALPSELYPPRFDNLLRRHPKVFFRRLLSLPSHIRALRNSCRPRYRDPQNLHNGFTLFSVQRDELLVVTEAERSRGVTFNDVLLALLLKSLAPLAERRLRAVRRRNIAVGSIVNLRKDLGVDSRRTFGLFLGSFVVTHEVAEGISLLELARDIRRQTLRIKRDRLYLALPLELACARLAFSCFSPERRKNLYQKFYLFGEASRT
jgi:NRPS condensation-like uncharacterized protein